MKSKKIKKRHTSWEDVNEIVNLLKEQINPTDEEVLMARIKNILYNPRYTNFTYEYGNQVVGFSFLEKFFYNDLSSSFIRVLMFLMKENFDKESIKNTMVEDARLLATEWKLDGIINSNELIYVN